MFRAAVKPPSSPTVAARQPGSAPLDVTQVGAVFLEGEAHDVAGFQHLAHSFAGAQERRAVRALVAVDLGGNGDDKDGAGAWSEAVEESWRG